MRRCVSWAVVPALVAAAGAASAQTGSVGGSAGAVVHTVSEGETLAQIAKDRGLSVRAVAEANGLRDAGRIRPGQEIRIPAAPPRSGDGEEASGPAGAGRGAAAEPRDGATVTRRGVVVRVADGQTLSDIAASYGVPLSRLLGANGIDDADSIRAGRRILVPGARRAVDVTRRRRDPWAGWSRPVTFRRVATGDEITVRLFDRRGKPSEEAWAEVDRLMRSPGVGRQRRTHVDLLRLLQRVADRWPDRRIDIHSGYRPYRRGQHTPRSRHNIGRAVDFTVEGVSNEDLRTFCRTLPDAGVGYYPNSRFVHLDARDRRAYWVDYSGSGEAPRYGREDLGDPAARGAADAPAAGPRGGNDPDEATADAEALADGAETAGERGSGGGGR